MSDDLMFQGYDAARTVPLPDGGVLTAKTIEEAWLLLLRNVGRPSPREVLPSEFEGLEIP